VEGVVEGARPAFELGEVELENGLVLPEQILGQLLDGERLTRAGWAEHRDRERPRVITVVLVLPDQSAQRVDALDLLAVERQVLPILGVRGVAQDLLSTAKDNAAGIGEHVFQSDTGGVAEEIRLSGAAVCESNIRQNAVRKGRSKRRLRGSFLLVWIVFELRVVGDLNRGIARCGEALFTIAAADLLIP